MSETQEILTQESFRDSVATISAEGKRNFINPKKPKGKLYNLRSMFSVFYLVVFFTLPFIKVHDEPLLMINILQRKFILFGMIFWPQDFFIFAIGLITFIVFVILFTVVFGRIFCGWACPQTIFMEMVFRKIEYLIDGDSTQQKLLKKQAWNGTKIRKRVLKFVIFFVLSFIIANFFLAYIISMDQLLNYITHPAANTGTLISLLVFTCVFFFVYWWFREQACIVVCPYGRLQGVLLDKNSIVVAYDYKRGEPRGKLGREATHKIKETEDDCKCVDCKGDGACKDLVKKFEVVELKGDCIDCHACVKVCPTGIDIRNGTQLECVNCTACIDACDAIMTSVHKPEGLIRYASENSIQEGVQLRFTRRIKAYTAVLCLLIALLAFLLVSRTDLDATLMRTAGMTYTSLPDGRISNLYNLKLANKTHLDIPVTLKLENVPGEIQMIKQGKTIVKKEDYTNFQFFVKLDRNQLKGWKTTLQIGLYDSTKKIKTITAKFIGPENYN
ncbi:MAG TPA: FixG Ig-like domain-containing protein [Ferruginibacter sp.]|nr:FixG Ig-like domain-containing protein [Ferruginibacter sp.]